MTTRTPTEDPRFYGRRKGKPLRAGRQKLMETLLPRLMLPGAPMPAGVTDGVGAEETGEERDAPQDAPGGRVIDSSPLDPWALFDPRPQGLWLEIGFGGGEHMTAQAAAHPRVGILGSEVFAYGIGKAVSQIDALGLDNVRLWPEDARLLLPRLPDGCLDKVFVLFPDPWPKTRHAKRRFIQKGTLDQIARLLVDGGELRIASDDPVYQEWALFQTTAHPLFAWTARAPADWRSRPADWVETRYEAKALAAGRAPMYLVFRRVARSGHAFSPPTPAPPETR